MSFRRSRRAGAMRVMSVLALAVLVAACATGPSRRTASAAPVPDTVLEERISAALDAQAAVPKGAITVDVASGIVTLSGVLGRHTDLQNLGAIVRAVPGVRHVRFAVRVGPKAATPGGRLVFHDAGTRMGWRAR